MNFMFKNNISRVSEANESVRYCSCHENIKFISSSQRVMFFLLYGGMTCFYHAWMNLKVVIKDANRPPWIDKEVLLLIRKK